MNKKDVVKARIHYGSKSLDITIPVRIIKSHFIKEGDVFTVEARLKNGETKLIYTRIFRQE